MRGSGLRYTIVRPSMIYGSELDKNVHRLLRFLDRSPLFPMFGSGKNLWQPVYHEDCARGVYEALVRPAAVGQSYDLPGAEPLTYLGLVRTAAGALGRTPRIVRVPLEPARRALSRGGGSPAAATGQGRAGAEAQGGQGVPLRQGAKETSATRHARSGRAWRWRSRA